MEEAMLLLLGQEHQQMNPILLRIEFVYCYHVI